MQCVKWKGQYYFYSRLVFGSRSSLKIFDGLSALLSWVAEYKYGIKIIIHLLDDFLCLEPPFPPADQTMVNLLKIISDLRISIAPHKQLALHTRWSSWALTWIPFQCRPDCRITNVSVFGLSFLY